MELFSIYLIKYGIQCGCKTKKKHGKCETKQHVYIYQHLHNKCKWIKMLW